MGDYPELEINSNEYSQNVLDRVRANMIRIDNPYDGEKKIMFRTETDVLDSTTEEKIYTKEGGCINRKFSDVYTETVEHNGNTISVIDLNFIITKFFIKWYNEDNP